MQKNINFKKKNLKFYKTQFLGKNKQILIKNIFDNAVKILFVNKNFKKFLFKLFFKLL
jgi:hypothetical protein